MGGYPVYGGDMEEPPEDLLRQQYAAAQQMGYTGSREPGPDPREVFANYRQDQQRFAQAGEQIQLKQQDLDLSGQMVKLLDPAVPKPAREFLYREMSRKMSVDPEGQHAKELGKMLLSLDPGTLDNMRQGFVSKVQSARPGEVNQTIRAIMTGQMTGMQMVGLADNRVGASTRPVEGGGAEGAPAAGSGAGGAPRPRAMEPTRRRIQGPGETPPRYQATDPKLVEMMGLDPKDSYRNDDLIRHGYTLPLDPKSQRELAEKIDTDNTNTLTTAVEASRMYQLFKGKPEVLSPVGGVTRTIDQIIDQSKGILNSLGIDFSGVKMEGDEGNTTRAAVKNAAEKISSLYKASGLENTAVDSARLQSAMINMAYSMAAARGIPGNRLTNAIVNQHLGELGNSGSVAQFEATLADTLKRAVDRTQNEVASKLGQSGGINVNSLSHEQLKTLYEGREILPESLKLALADRMDRISAGNDKPTLKSLERASPTIEEEERLQAGDQARKEDRELLAEQRSQQELKLKELREERQDRMEQFTKQRAIDADRKEERRYQLALRKEERQAEHQRRQEIAAAFARLGAAIAGSRSGSISGGGGGGGGGNEDASAFRVQPLSGARRTAPQPIDASRFQRRG